MKILFEKDEHVLKEKAAKEVSQFISKQHPTLLLLAGGSAFSFLDLAHPEIFSQNLTIGMEDERYSFDESINNFSQLTKTKFYSQGLKRGVHFIDSRVKNGESFEKFGERFARSIENWLTENPRGEVVATFGIGEDGHTAGILPHPKNREEFETLFEQSATAIAFDAKEKNLYPLRVTVTLPFIRTKIQKALVYIVSEKKREAFKKVLATEGTIEETPAKVLKEIPNVIFFSNINL